MSHHYIDLKQVTYRYSNGTEALSDVSLHISHGEKIALLGKNGAGKSTLLQLLDGLLMPTEGKIDVGGVTLSKKTLPHIRQTIGMVFQNPDDQLFMPTVEEDVAFGPLNMGLSQAEVEARVREALGSVGCLELARRSPMQLSGGQKRRVAIATVLSMQPSILVLDEPTSNLDWGARESVVRLIEQFMHTTIVASHDLALIKKICHRALVLEGGRLIADCEIGKVFESREILKALGINKEDLSDLCICGG